MEDVQIIPDNTQVSTDNGAVSTGDRSTPTAKFFDEIDPNKISPEELRFYKKFQAPFTRSTQKYADEKRELENELNTHKSLLSDNLIAPLAYYRQNGRLPDGVDASTFLSNLGTQLGVKPNIPVNNAPVGETPFDPSQVYLDENTNKYIQGMIGQAVDKATTPLLQKLRMTESFVGNEVNQKATSTVNSFKEKLVAKDAKLGELFDKFASNGKLKEALTKVPSTINTMDEAMKFAFNAVAGEEYAQLVEQSTRAKVLEELRNKDIKDRPLTTGSNSQVKSVGSKDLRKILEEEFDKVAGT